MLNLIIGLVFLGLSIYFAVKAFKSKSGIQKPSLYEDRRSIFEIEMDNSRRLAKDPRSANYIFWGLVCSAIGLYFFTH